jgi:hypothetical protein
VALRESSRDNAQAPAAVCGGRHAAEDEGEEQEDEPAVTLEHHLDTPRDASLARPGEQSRGSASSPATLSAWFAHDADGWVREAVALGRTTVIRILWSDMVRTIRLGKVRWDGPV